LRRIASGVVRIGDDEPVHVPDEVIDALRKRERDGAIDLPNAKRGRKNPRIGDRLRIVSGPFVESLRRVTPFQIP
jgi:transcription antitermination factor NusG